MSTSYSGSGASNQVSPHTTALSFCVKKKSGELRVVLDYRKINFNSMPDKYVIRTVNESIDIIGKDRSRIFSSLDLASGYWQQGLHPESRKYSAFTLPGAGRFEWVVTPMGLHGSPASFSRLMDHVMQKVKGVITYIDDLLIHSHTHDQHLTNLRGLL